MTDRLYYDDPYEWEFDASVIRVEPRGADADHRDRYAAWLDRTAFYPTTGSQPFDTGTLGDARVVDVLDDDHGDVVHVLEGAAPQVGQMVHGVVDWPRRFDHMQQHTGQHVLSAAFVGRCGAKTVSIHLGADVSTIDLAREVTPADIASAEDEANRIVWADRPVTIRYASAEEAAVLPLRKESSRTGTLRLIDIDAFDLSACGGTHVGRTGAIGVIVVAASERFKGGQRLEFLCGGRVLTRFRALRDVTGAGVRLLSVLPADLPGAIERLQMDLKDQKRLLAALQSDMAHYQAREFAAAADTFPGGRLVLRAVDADAPGLKSLASAITSAPGFVVVLVSRSAPALVVAARSADLGTASHEIVTALTKRFGGRGGGKPDLAQAGGLNAPVDEILAEARRLVVNAPKT
jgi:alanyl-tRNA synthetase